MKKKIFAFVFVLLAISIFTLSSFALSPPQITVGVAVSISSHFTEAEARQVSQLVNYQYLAGSFNGLEPLLLRTSSSGEVVLFLQDHRYSGYYSISGSSAVLGGSSTVIRALLTVEGFSILSNYTASATNFEASSVVAYADSNGLWQYNDSYSYGSTSGISSNAYGVWSNYYFSLVQYEMNIDNARTEGYDEGYTVGQQAGYTSGYNNGVGVGYQSGLTDGYNNGFDEGYDEGYGVGFDDGVASVPPGSGSDRVVTAYVTFANGEIPSPDGDNVILVKNGSFRFLGSDDLLSLLNDGYSIYSIDYDIFASQLSSGSSIRFKIPDELQRAFPSFTWPVVVVTDLRPEDPQLRVFLYQDSYEAGYQNGIQDGDMILDGIAGVATAPVDGLRAALDFEIFGLNVGAVAIGCVAVALILIAWRFIRKIIPV